MARTKLVHMLRTRESDADAWGPGEAYPTKAQRDKASAFLRIIGGLRTHSYEERVPVDSAPPK